MRPPKFLRRSESDSTSEKVTEAMLENIRHISNRPYIDLSSPPANCVSAIHQRGLQLGCQLLLRDDHTPITCQMMPATGFRDVLLREHGLQGLRLTEPHELAVQARSRAWEVLIERVDRFPSGAPPVKALILFLLCRLSLFSAAAGVARMLLDEEKHDTAHDTCRLYGAIALQRIGASEASRDILLHAARYGAEPRVRLSAAVMLLVDAAKARPPRPAEVNAWAELASKYFPKIPDYNEHWRRASMESWYWRAMSFVPFFQRDWRRTNELLDRAEELCAAIPGHGIVSDVAWGESVRPLFETRTKAAKATADRDLIIHYARRLADIDPGDPKSHIQLGHTLLDRNDFDGAVRSYQQAIEVGPPWRAAASFFLGAAQEGRTDWEAARNAYVQALHFDARAISAEQRLATLVTTYRRSLRILPGAVRLGVVI